jgi:hypothetical protein
VAHLFAFCLGVVAGVNSVNAGRAGKPVGQEDLPQGYSFAGSALDAAAGDALLRTKGSWYLLEMKRGYAQLRDEFQKPRVVQLRGKLLSLNDAWREHHLFKVARMGHQFLYPCRNKGGTVPELATLSYLDWLVDSQPNRASEWKAKSMRFVEFLLGRPADQGFTFHQLVEYVALMNATKSPVGGAASAATRLGLVVDAAGSATLLAHEQLEHLLAHDVEAALRARSAVTGEPQPSTHPPTSANDQHRGPRSGTGRG